MLRNMIAGTQIGYQTFNRLNPIFNGVLSRKIPRITRSLIEWLEELPKYELDEWELSSHELSPRAFYPRLLIGEFLSDEFSKLCELLKKQGHQITVKMSEHVADLIGSENGSTNVTTEGGVYEFDHVIIARAIHGRQCQK